MAVSKAIVPLLKGKEAESFMKTLESSKLKPYTEEEKERTERKAAEALAARAKN